MRRTLHCAASRAGFSESRGGLVGTGLFERFREVSPKVWKGKVFVSDINKVFTGTGTVKDQNTVVARGCFLEASAASCRPGREFVEPNANVRSPPIANVWRA